MCMYILCYFSICIYYSLYVRTMLLHNCRLMWTYFFVMSLLTCSNGSVSLHTQVLSLFTIAHTSNSVHCVWLDGHSHCLSTGHIDTH